MNFSCSACGSRDWPNDSGCPLCRTEPKPEETMNEITKIENFIKEATWAIKRAKALLDDIEAEIFTSEEALDLLTDTAEDIANTLK